jgi:hypothetical protein
MTTRPMRWRQTGIDVYEVGNRTHGAVAWRWNGDWFRIQCWTYPRNRLITFRAPRKLEVAKRTAQRWLDAHPPKGTQLHGLAEARRLLYLWTQHCADEDRSALRAETRTFLDVTP